MTLVLGGIRNKVSKEKFEEMYASLKEKSSANPKDPSIVKNFIQFIEKGKGESNAMEE